MKIWTLKLTFRNATLLQNKSHQDVNQQILLPRNKNFPQGPLSWHQNSQKYFTGKLHKIVLLRRFIWNLRTSFLRTINTTFPFLQEQPGFYVDRRRKLRRKIHSRHRFMTTAALYSTTERKRIPMTTQILQPWDENELKCVFDKNTEISSVIF